MLRMKKSQFLAREKAQENKIEALVQTVSLGVTVYITNFGINHK